MLVPKPQSLSMALVAGIFLAALPAQAITISSFDLANVDVDFLAGGTIDFDLDFLFDDFDVGAQTGGTGALFGLGGEIDGAFTFDTLGSVTTGGSTFSIDDGDGDNTGTDDILTGVLDFETIDLVDVAVSQVVSLNGSLTFDPTYTGANADLLTLSTSGIEYFLSTDFFFTGLTTLDALFAGGDAGGTLVASVGQVTVPEPQSLAILGMGLIGIGLFARKKNQDQPCRRRRSAKSSSYAYGIGLAA